MVQSRVIRKASTPSDAVAVAPLGVVRSSSPVPGLDASCPSGGALFAPIRALRCTGAFLGSSGWGDEGIPNGGNAASA